MICFRERPSDLSRPRSPSRRTPGTRIVPDVVIDEFDAATQVLKSHAVRQGGFNARMIARLPLKNRSVLFAEGDLHRRQRSLTARFFTPRAAETYRPFMREVSRTLVRQLRASGTMKLDDMSLAFTAAVAGHIVGIGDPAKPGFAKRLSRFFEDRHEGSTGWFGSARFIATSLLDLLLVYVIDVRPALRERRRRPRQDLLSFLANGRVSTLDLLTECITYSAAGLSTTREFIVVAAIVLLEDDARRERFLQADDDGKIDLLEEILRDNPIVRTIYRRTTGQVRVATNRTSLDLADETLVAIDVATANAGGGACPAHDRTAETSSRKHLSFGDGAHRCPGATVALLETAVFLEDLLREPDVRLVESPVVEPSIMLAGPTFRNAVLKVGA